MGKLIKIIIVAAAVLAILIVGRNVFIKIAVEKGVEVATGLPLTIEKFDMGIASTHIGIKELNLFNPAGFPQEVMFHAPEIFVDYDLGAMLKGKIHLEDIRLDFDQFVIVKNKDGLVNLETLKPKEGDPAQPKAEEKPKETKKKTDFAIQIDHLQVKVGKVVYKDYSKGAEPSVEEFRVNISEEFSDISNSNLSSLILAVAQKALLKTTVSSLVDLNMDMISDATAIPMEAVDTFKNAAGTFTDKLKLPFGK